MSDWVARSRWRLGVVGALASIAAGWCLEPLVTGGWWAPSAAIVVGLTATVGILLRALRAPAPVQPLLQTATLLLALVALFTPAAATLGFLPDSRTLPALRQLVATGQSDAWASVPPAGPTPGLMLLIAAGIGLVFIMVDTLGAGLDLPGLALLPLAALYVTPWLIGTGFPAAWSFAVAMGAWLAVLATSQADQHGWQIRGGHAGSLPRLALVSVASLGLALAVGSLTPASSGLLRAQGEGPQGRLVTVDEVVSLRRQLVSDDEREVFRYRTSAQRPDYFRLAVLTEFDGQNWRSANSTTPWDSPPRDALPDTYRLRIGPLNGPVVPSPAGTWQVRSDSSVGWDTATGLPVRSDGSPVADSRATLNVATEAWSPRELRAASRDPQQPSGGALSVHQVDPRSPVGEQLGRLARTVAAGTLTTYDAAVALQDWFTNDGGFRYSTEVPQGASGDDLARFLEERVGYCEQFAATMALMARSLGIPARVVVGFTQGRQVEVGWSVRATDAHAWPELWLGSAGWVRFEPTPRSNSVRLPGYADRPAAAEPAPLESAEAADEREPRRPAPDTSEQPASAEEVATAQADDPTTWPAGPAWLVPALLGLALLMSAPAVRALRRRVRLNRGEPALAGEAAYAELVDTLIDLRVEAPSITPRQTGEHALRAAGDDPSAQVAVEHIVAAVEAARFGPQPELHDDLSADVRSLRRAIRHHAPRLTWLRANALPRSLLGRRRG